jgi:hypothetical protein
MPADRQHGQFDEADGKILPNDLALARWKC